MDKMLNQKNLIAVLLLVGVVLRLYYFVYPLGRSSEVTVDEAVYGVQALKIANGERPVFYPAQDYTGSFSAYISAVIFSIFGVSAWGLKIIPFLFSVGTIWLIFLLARRTFGQKVGLCALFFASLGTPFWNNWSSRAGTGYVEATFAGLLILLLTIRLLDGELNLKRRAVYFTLLGLLSGLGFWMQPTIVYFVVPALAFLFINLRTRFFVPFLFFCLGFAVGGFPVVYYNFVIKPSGTTGALFKKPWGMRGAFFKLILEGFPVLLGGRTSNSTRDFNPITSPLIYLFFISALGYFLKIILNLRNIRRAELLVFLTLISTLAIFLTSTPFNQLSIEPRYVFSLHAVLPIILGLFFERFWSWKALARGVLLALFFASAFLGVSLAPPLSFVDGYNFKPLVPFVKNLGISYVISTPAVGHRLMFYSGNSLKVGIRGGGIMEARFEKVNQEVTRARDLDPRMVAYVSLKDESELANFQTEGKYEYGLAFSQKEAGSNFSVIYSGEPAQK